MESKGKLKHARLARSENLSDEIREKHNLPKEGLVIVETREIPDVEPAKGNDMSKCLWCPNCKKKTLNPYNSRGERPKLVDDIHHLWCLACDYTITSEYPKKTEKKSEEKK